MAATTAVEDDKLEDETEHTLVEDPLAENDGLLSTDDSEDRLTMLSRIRWWLYVSHFFVQFSDWTWQFSIVLFMGAFTNFQSLFLVSTYSLGINLSVCLFGSYAGQFIDKADRLHVLRVFILTENASCLGATILSYMLMNEHTTGVAVPPSEADPAWLQWLLSRLDGVPLSTRSIVLLVLIHVLGSLAMLLNQGFLVAIERDWIVVMSKLASPKYGTTDMANVSDRASTQWLADTNVFMKQIDLASSIGAPAVVGFILALCGGGGGDTTASSGHENLSSAAILVGGVNVLALVIEYIVSQRMYDMIPDLASKMTDTEPKEKDSVIEKLRLLEDGQQSGNEEEGDDDEEEEEEEEEEDVDDEKKVNDERIKSCGCIRLPYGLSVYLKQPIALGGIGFAVL